MRNTVEKLKSSHKSHGRIDFPVNNDASFTVQHFAGPVEYTLSGFLEKNRDSLASNMLSCLQQSGIDMVRESFLGEVTSSGVLIPCAASSSASGSTGGRRGGTSIDRPTQVGRPPSGTSHRRPDTLGTQFRNSLSELVERMRKCQFELFFM